MPKPPTTLELLNQVLQEERLSAEELDDLCARRVPEDQRLEYKSGKLLERKDAPAVLREYVSAFANSDGGLLLVGVEELKGEGVPSTPIAVDGCTAPGGKGLVSWATTCLEPLAPYLSPVPRILPVSHAPGEVLAIATARARGWFL